MVQSERLVLPPSGGAGNGASPTNEPPPLPDDIIETVRQLQDDTDNLQFALGDLIVAVTDELGSAYEPYSHNPSFLIMTLIANRAGVAKSTLIDREKVARFFPKEIREKYPYTYGQFRALKKAGDRWQEYADYFLDHLPAPVSIISEKIRRDKTNEPPWMGRFEKFGELAQVLIKDEEAPDFVKRCARSCMLSLGIAFGEYRKRGHWKTRHTKQ